MEIALYNFLLIVILKQFFSCKSKKCGCDRLQEVTAFERVKLYWSLTRDREKEVVTCRSLRDTRGDADNDGFLPSDFYLNTWVKVIIIFFLQKKNFG